MWASYRNRAARQSEVDSFLLLFSNLPAYGPRLFACPASPGRLRREEARIAMATRKTELYEDDFYRWSREQAAALRRLSAERWNGPLDLEHLAEEVEELGSDVRNAARSHLRRLLSTCPEARILARIRAACRLDRHDRRCPRRDRRAAYGHHPQGPRGPSAGRLCAGASPGTQGAGQGGRARDCGYPARGMPLCLRAAPRRDVVSDQPPGAITRCVTLQE